MIAYWVYLLSDPETNEPRYVGLTQDPARRARFHRGRPRTTKMARLRQWYTDLRLRKVRPTFTELACISGENAATVEQTARLAERHWIAHYAALYPQALLNVNWNAFARELLNEDPEVRRGASPYRHIEYESCTVAG